MNYTTNDTKEFVSKFVANAMYKAFCKLNPLAFEEEPKKWTMKNTSQLRQLSSMASSIGYHYKHGFVENKFYELRRINSLTHNKKIIFCPNTYFINPITGVLKSNKMNGVKWGLSKNERIRCMCKEENGSESFSVFTFRKSHLIFAAIYPEISIKNIDHIDGNYRNNSIFNLDSVTVSMNTIRQHRSTKGKEGHIKRASKQSHKIWMLDENKKRIKMFTSLEEAGKFLVNTLKVTKNMRACNKISRALRLSNAKSYGYFWEYDCVNPTRRGSIDGYPLIIKNYTDLSERRKKQILKKISGSIDARPPISVTNYGEILNRRYEWTLGNIYNRTSKVHKWASRQHIHVWVMLYFHDNDDDIDKYLEGQLAILHKDGDMGDKDKYHFYTHEDSDDCKPYTNAYFTLRLGTIKDNIKDNIAKKNRIINSV